MKFIPIIVASFLLLFSCTDSESTATSKQTFPDNQTKKVIAEKVRDTVRYIFHLDDTLVSVDHFNKNIWWELKYATADNFMQRVLYDTLQRVYVQIDVARRLAQSQTYLTSRNENYHLLVYDGLRPLSVQWEMWNALDSIPPIRRGKFVSNPRMGSVHNYGAAVDVTICDQSRKPLDMGAGYDDMNFIAYPSLESEYLATGELKQFQVDNRKLLRRAMKSQGFSNIPTEWWHFNAFPRPIVKQKYQLVTKELN